MKIIAHYDNEKFNNENRQFSLACTNKIDYIVEALETNKIAAEIISPAMSTMCKKHCKSKKYNIGKFSTVTLMPTSGKNNVLGKILNRFYSKIYFTIYLLVKIKKHETIWCYHSLFLMTAIKLLKKIKKINLLLEVEEIYADVLENRKLKKKELDFIDIGDKYIFPTMSLNTLINHCNKPYVLIHGTYKVEPLIANNFNNGKIHCVYAGTLDVRKGGAIAAAAAAEYLNEKYHIHIIGFGTEKQQTDLINFITEISATSKCKVTYDGLKSGNKYIEFLQSCHIGLSTQNPSAAFNDTSFPSKILSYLANGLRVVTVKLDAIKSSKVNHLLYYYDGYTAEKLADAIKEITLNDNYDSRAYIAQLDIEFKNNLTKLIGANNG